MGVDVYPNPVTKIQVNNKTDRCFLHALVRFEEQSHNALGFIIFQKSS